MIESLGIKLITAFKDPLLKIGKDIKNEFFQAFLNGLSNYVDNYYDKFSKTKTFIYRDEKVNFYDIFFPVTLKNNNTGILISEIKDIKHFFFEKKFVTIIGSAGSGKSMLMKHIFLSIVNQFYSIPIIIELRNLNNYEGNLADYISNIILKHKLSLSERITERILNEGNFVFLFDGYDEIFSENKDKITNDIEEFVDLYNKNSFIITSRPGANAESLQRFDNLYIQPLIKKQINEFISLQFNNHDNKESIGKIISAIEKPDNKDYEDYLSSPLLLSMFIFTFNNYPELPKTKNKFYWNVFDTLCTKHDTFTKKGFWLHERRSKLLNEDFENLLKWFSYVSLFNGMYNFEIEFLKNQISDIKKKLNLSANIDDIIYDLTVSISILIQDGTEFTFPHKSLQEYFTATLIKGLNEEQKKIIYENKFLKLRRMSYGGNLNFYKLCYEIDKHNFSKYFLINNVKSFLKNIDNTNEITLAHSFIKFFSLRLSFTLIDGKFTQNGGGYSSVSSETFLSFFTKKRIIPPPHVTNNNAIEYILDLLHSKAEANTIEKRVSLNLYTEDWSNGIQDYVINSGICDHISEMYSEIKSNLEILEKETRQETLNTQQLLDI